MTISSTTRTAGPFSGNDVTTTFAFTFKVFTASDLELVQVTPAGVSTTLTITTDYTVTLNADQNAAPGGSITLTSALATGYTLIITSNIAALQATDLTNQGGFYPQVITNALDKLTILTQQILGKVGRSLNFPIQDTSYNPTLPAKAQRVGRVLAFDETTGDPAPGPTIVDVGTVGAAVTAIETVAANIASVNTDATNITSINTVAGSIDSVNTTAANVADVNTVAGIAADVTAVAYNETNINAAVAALPDLAGKVSKTSATGSAGIPAGTQAQRDVSPSAGNFRFNTDLSKFEGYNGAAWGAVGGGATGGGGDAVFVENAQVVTADYTIPAGKNAMSTGTVTINSGVTVTVSSGSVWAII